LVVGLLSVVALIGGAQADTGDEPDDGPFARGFGYLGAFWVTQSSTEIQLF